MPSISSFEINKVNPFPAYIASFPLTFLSSLSIEDEIALVANLGLAEGTTRYNNTFSA